MKNKAAMFAKVTDKESSDIYSTPMSFVNGLEVYFRIKFKLDVCANSTNAKCHRYYTIEQNSLIQEWSDLNWCNPPYSNIGDFVRKAIKDKKETWFLIPSRTDRDWFHEAINSGAHVIFLEGLLAFISINAISFDELNGKKKSPFACLILIVNPKDRYKDTKSINIKEIMSLGGSF